ncbi:MAG: hypothetical protein Q7T03_02295 [Deltaproteobacteria bacterium]|nr:hypothetical protein [Deltaproteobacteria bacterium]
MNNSRTTNDVSYIWTRFNLRWLLTGIVAGLGAGLMMMLVAALLATKAGLPATFPIKLVGAAVFGGQAMQVDSFIPGGMAGTVIHFGLAAFFGLVFAQFVAEWSRKRVLILMGVLGGMAVWLFWSAMFMPAFNQPMAHLLTKPVSILLHVTFGLSFGLLMVCLRPVFVRE